MASKATSTAETTEGREETAESPLVDGLAPRSRR